MHWQRLPCCLASFDGFGYVITGQIADSLNTPVRKALILGKKQQQ